MSTTRALPPFQHRLLSSHPGEDKKGDGKPATSVGALLKEIWDDRNVSLPVNEAQERMWEEQAKTAEDKWEKENPISVLWERTLKPILGLVCILFVAYGIGSDYYREWKNKQNATSGEAYRTCIEYVTNYPHEPIHFVFG
jgi:hypothetical protein